MERESGQTLQLARRHYENFPVLSRFLPPELRGAFSALYAFARVTDDLGDEGGMSREERLRALSDWRSALDRAVTEDESEVATHPAIAGVSQLVRQRVLPIEPLHDLIEANCLDQLKLRYDSYGELEGYCRLSANPLGRLVLRLFDSDRPSLHAAADALCTGLQLANHWQGIGPDLRLRGRLYVPLEDLRRFGVDEADLRRDRATRPVRALLGFQVDRTRLVLARADALPAALPRGPRSVVRLFGRGGRAALDQIEKRPDAVLRGGARVPRRRALLELTLEALCARR